VYVVKQMSLQLRVTVRCGPEVMTFLKHNWVKSAEWSNIDSLPDSSLKQRYVSGVIQKSLELTVTFSYELKLTFSNRTVLCLQSGVHLTHSVPSSLAQRYVSVVKQISLQLRVTDRCGPEVMTFLKQNWVKSAEWSKIDSLPDSYLAQRYVSGVIQTSLQLTITVRFIPELEFLKQNWFMSAE
jgi:hypothetical protein